MGHRIDVVIYILCFKKKTHLDASNGNKKKMKLISLLKFIFWFHTQMSSVHSKS